MTSNLGRYDPYYETVNLQERYYRDRVETWVSSPSGWVLLKSEPIDRLPFYLFEAKGESK